jgi:branched-chain amino acid transport system permease protein
MSVPLIGAAYMPAVGFALMFLILLFYPKGILGDRS